jgi:hypothetical protein
LTAPHHSEAGASAPVFRRLDGPCTSRFSLPEEVIQDQIRINMGRDLPRFHLRADYGKRKDRPLAIVGGGPSLRKTINELHDFKDVMVCGSAHDYVVNSGINPKYAVVCSARHDPGELPSDFIKCPRYFCEYLIASCCHPAVFDALCDQNVTLWNSYAAFPHEIYNNEPLVQGGSSVVLRALPIAILLGYYDLHFFGFDSCFEKPEENHAYDAGAHSLEHDLTKVRIGAEDGPEFLTHIAWLVQARDFQEMCKHMGHLFNPIIHGDGLIAEIMRQAAQLQAKEN